MLENAWIILRCVLAFAAFMVFSVALDWVIARVLGPESSQFFRR